MAERDGGAPGGPSASPRRPSATSRDRSPDQRTQRAGPPRPPGGPGFMQRIRAGRGARRQRALTLILAAASCLVLLAAVGAWAVTSYVNASLTRVDAGTTGTPSSGPLNILVAGVDQRSGLTAQQQRQLHVGHVVSSNSDTLMLAHIPADHQSIQVVSLPRDSWVDIPGHGMNKINAAFGLGGPKLMVRTVEHATGLVINDYVEVNFLAFVRVINALGGVNICLPFAIDDPYSGLHLPAGPHHVDGVTALKYARDRHSFAASDFARIRHQQELLSSLLREAVSAGTLTNPAKLASLVSAVGSALRVDQGFNLVSLVDQLRGISPSNVSFTTVPIGNPNYLTPTGESAVLWNQAAARSLFTAIRNDNPVSMHPRHGPASRESSRHRTGAHGRPAARHRPGHVRGKTAAQDACK